MKVEIYPIKSFSDNYIWAIINWQNMQVTCIDPGDCSVVIDFLAQKELTLNTVLITHHHHDHIGGLKKLKQKFPKLTVYTPNDERITLFSEQVSSKESLIIPSLELEFKIILTPGHTSSHISYYNEEYNLLFCGDVLFSAGCGRVFEGSNAQMYNSLHTLSMLPPSTKVYCAHEYTHQNLLFALTVEPNNLDIKNKLQEVLKLKKQQLPTLPSSIGEELKINPFLRCMQNDVIAHAIQYDAKSSSPIDIFTIIRNLKDHF